MIVDLWFTYPQPALTWPPTLSNPRRHLATSDFTMCGLPTKNWVREEMVLQRDTDLCHWCVSNMAAKRAAS